MKTIAIYIDDETLERVRDIERREGRSRSEIIREAVSEYVEGVEDALEQEREKKIFRRLRDRLRKQAEALIQDQAEP